MNLEIANRLQKLRKERGYSQEELAQELGISRQAVSKWERAEASPDTDNLICLAKLYNVSLDYLLSSDDSIETIKAEQMPEVKIEAKKSRPRWMGITISIIPIAITILYIVLGGFLNLWHPGWIVFLFIPILDSLIEAIYLKNPSAFSYPVLVTAVFLFLGCVYSMWYPWWALYITIPIFYSICGAFNKKESEEDEEAEEEEDE